MSCASRSPLKLSPLTWPSRPGEFHPEPLTDSGLEPLDSSGSCHPLKAAAFRRNLASSSPLTLVDPDASDLLPSLLGHYPGSSLLRSSPPLVGPSALSASRFCRLCLLTFCQSWLTYCQRFSMLVRTFDADEDIYGNSQESKKEPKPFVLAMRSSWFKCLRSRFGNRDPLRRLAGTRIR